jgi:dihydroxy-acid dehydratase
LLATGDRVRIDLRKGAADVLIPKAEFERRRAALQQAGGFAVPESQTPWQEMYRETVTQMSDGQIIRGADRYRRVAQTGIPRDNH